MAKCHRRCRASKRHVFSREEARRGYQAAKAKVDAAHPDWKCKHGKALSHCLLRALQPVSYARVTSMRQAIAGIEAQLDGVEARLGQEVAKTKRIRRELALLKEHGDSYTGNLRDYIGDMGLLDEERIH